MMGSSEDLIVRDFLSALERAEARLLTWGVVDGGFSSDEVLALAQERLQQPGRDDSYHWSASELVDEAMDRRLLFRYNVGGIELYRSRMAESVRLFSRLRQILRGRDWRTAPTLVSDFRFVLRPRVYPRRDTPLATAKQIWAADGVLSKHRQQAIDALFADRRGMELSGFQVRAANHVFRSMDGERSRGMIVAVGTGSGKTLAFYLPALTHLSTLVQAGEYWTKAVAIYPRKELLKDQFSEAFAEARRLDRLLQSQPRRKIVIGAFYEDTPYQASEEYIGNNKAWRKDSGGYVCPFLRCPACGAEVRWSGVDLRAKAEVLTCVDVRCARRIESDEIVLTRQRMRDQPPDVLFTTTEMLNRRMSDSRMRHVFGVGASRRPHLLLLDEVHTYLGTSGAQVALLLRRWRNAVGKAVHFTGLSATLINAGEFFAALVGLPPTTVEEVTPRSDEVTAEGMEYLLALRGDPVSRTALLSTTIQAAILLGRVLDPRSTSPSQGVYGQKVFAFTDDLDVTNRLYHNLLDAEGWDGWARRQIRTPLASSRARSAPRPEQRFLAGQSWALAEEIGHREGLASSLRIGRTSSQDVGVESAADIVVATASLEVGFDDPHVGAVIQHKAPRDAAAFLQRKGRAGRPRVMRPWTVVVLSDYGRDRVAYQGYDSLFDPTLQPRTIPLSNRYVLRIQAAYALMDWVTEQTAHSPALRGSLFEDWSGPAIGDEQWVRARRSRQQYHGALLRRLLEGDAGSLRSLRSHLVNALDLDDSVVEALLWEPPRALMTAVIPTILRRLESGWGRVILRDGESPQDLVVAHAPLPDFVPQNLFSDLNLPEVTVYAKDGQRGEEREDTLPITQALRTLAPGNVTRRFAVRSSRASHWVAPPSLLERQQQVPVEGLCETYEELGDFQSWDGDRVINVRCIRPWSIRPTIPDPTVLPSSKSQLVWRTQIVPAGDGIRFDLPDTLSWSALLQSATFYIHNHRSHVEVRRFAIGADATVALQRGREFTPKLSFVHQTDTGSQPAAIGFNEYVDALVFRCRLNTMVETVDLDKGSFAPPELRALRTAYFRHMVNDDEELKEHANVFKRDWLHQIYLSTIAAWAIATETSIENAVETLRADRECEEKALKKVLNVVFQTLPDDEDAEDNIAADEEAKRQRVHNELVELLDRRTVTGRLAELARVLWEPVTEGFREWITKRYRATLGAALLSACKELYPEAASDDLLVDLDSGPPAPGTNSSDKHDIWITETTIGGGGVLEEVLRRFAADPRRFFQLAESVLEASDFEVVDAELLRVLEMLEEDRELAAHFAEVRGASDHAALEDHVVALRTALGARGVHASHAVMSALHARVLRPGSDPQTDGLLRDLVRRWRVHETRLGIEVDARVFAYLESTRSDYDVVLKRLDAAQEADVDWRFKAISGLLWPRGHSIRGQALSVYNPYNSLAETDRHLLLSALGTQMTEVPVSDRNWRAQLTKVLQRRAVARLTATTAEARDLKRVLLDMVTQPIEVDYLQLYPRVNAVVRGPSGYVVDVYVEEVLQ